MKELIEKDLKSLKNTRNELFDLIFYSQTQEKSREAILNKLEIVLQHLEKNIEDVENTLQCE